jgi:hypothetical protein
MGSLLRLPTLHQSVVQEYAKECTHSFEASRKISFQLLCQELSDRQLTTIKKQLKHNIEYYLKEFFHSRRAVKVAIGSRTSSRPADISRSTIAGSL